MGTTMGSDLDFVQMLEFVNTRKIHPKVDRVFDLADAGEAFRRMNKGDQLGKIILIP